MIIDIHTHTFPARVAESAIGKLSHASHTIPFSDGSAEGLLSTMTAAGIDLSLILPVATSERQVEHINDSAAALNEAYSGKGLFSFGCIHPNYENYRKELLRIKELGLKGVKIHPVYQGVDLDDPRYLRIFDRIAELGLIAVTHTGLDVGFPGVVRCSPQMALHVVKEIGDFSFILAHMGGWKNWDEVPELLGETHVYLDTSFSTGRMHPLSDGYWTEKDLDLLDRDGFMRLYRAFGPDRLLFGTDSPWSPQTESVSFIQELPLGAKEKRKILGENAALLLKLM
ncbi:MAG: amidohydrolase family protein [Lachnospiraceae bacterium]|nr:amidohydrolase family protein [Lachnospiraceae bacterium]